MFKGCENQGRCPLAILFRAFSASTRRAARAMKNYLRFGEKGQSNDAG
jgi:hypothetical protein